jgi:hypothetical protein
MTDSRSDKQNQSDTPRTDAQHAKWRIHDDPYTGMVNLARQLEIELTLCRAVTTLCCEKRALTPSHGGESGALKAAEETISKSMSWISSFQCTSDGQKERKAGMLAECRDTLVALRSLPPSATRPTKVDDILKRLGEIDQERDELMNALHATESRTKETP